MQIDGYIELTDVSSADLDNHDQLEFLISTALIDMTFGALAQVEDMRMERLIKFCQTGKIDA